MSEPKLVDARGGFCPGPLMELIATLKTLEVGQSLELLSTDEGSTADVPEWVHKVGHKMGPTSKDAEGVWHIVVEKAK
jgi:Predicted redox protein, regulator of disulfide bond formation